MSLPALRIFGRRKPRAAITYLNSRPRNLLPTSGEAKHDRVLPRRMNGTGSCRLIEIVVMNEPIVGKKRVLAMALHLEIMTIIWMVMEAVSLLIVPLLIHEAGEAISGEFCCEDSRGEA
jgi:hypothetical protein